MQRRRCSTPNLCAVRQSLSALHGAAGDQRSGEFLPKGGLNERRSGEIVLSAPICLASPLDINATQLVTPAPGHSRVFTFAAL